MDARYVDVYIIVEGSTERNFVNGLLVEHLLAHGVRAEALLTGTRQPNGSHRGGHRNSYQAIRLDIACTLDEHCGRGALVSTMLDLYALPDDFPGFVPSAREADPYMRAESIEAAIAEDFPEHRHRLIPYIQVHEFEALVLAGTDAIEFYFPEQHEGVARLAAEVAGFANPELVNDSPETAPSKRLERSIHRYRKAIDGPLIAQRTGLDTIRNRCPHFNEWLRKIEAIGGTA